MAGFQVEEKKERSFLQVVRTQFLQPLEKMSCHCMMNMALEDWIMSHAAARRCLAHLSLRLKSELIVWEGIRCPLSSDSVVCNFFKRLRNHWADGNPISYGAYTGWLNFVYVVHIW